MKRAIAVLLATSVFLPAIASAQIKTIPGESITVTTTVDAIDRASRSVTLRWPDNTVVKITVP